MASGAANGAIAVASWVSGVPGSTHKRGCRIGDSARSAARRMLELEVDPVHERLLVRELRFD